MRTAWWHVGRLALLVVLAGLIAPTSSVHPVTLSLTDVQGAKEVDFDDGVVWLLALGSDARGGEELSDARVDAIQLVGLDLDSGRAVGIGIPRDFYVELPDGAGTARINTATQEGRGPDAMAEVVTQLVGIEPRYVLLTGFDGFSDMVDAIGGITVREDEPFSDPYTGITVERGANEFEGDEALDYARSRRDVTGDDLGRVANQQQAMLGVLRRLLSGEDEPGFLEQGTLAAITGFETDLSPVEVYRLAQAVTMVRPDRVTTCVLSGTPDVSEFGEDVILPDFADARRIGADAADVRIDDQC